MEPNITPSYHLSPTQALLWNLMSRGLQQQELCTRLHIAPSTLKYHRKLLYQKLQVYNQYEAIKLYLLTFGPPDT